MVIMAIFRISLISIIFQQTMKRKERNVIILGLIMMFVIIITSFLSCIPKFDTKRLTFEYKDGKKLTWIDRGGILDVQERSTIILDSCGEKEEIEVYYNIHSIIVGDTLVVILDSLAYMCSPVAIEALNKHGIPVKISEKYLYYNKFSRELVDKAKSDVWPSKESIEYYRKLFYE